MSTWLKLLTLELSSIEESDIIEPDYALEKGDRQVGKMSDMNKQLFTLGRLLEKSAKQLQLDANYCNDKAKRVELETKFYELIAKSEIIRELMWIGIRDEFGLWGESIGIRTGFRVVIRPDDTEGGMLPFLKGLFGG